uniref:Putative basic helix-loop-helix protein At1g64625 n=1 Tax=Anthurium amnicola TaxID=1678845 RepID=A0A1D1ZGY5_9ARAE
MGSTLKEALRSLCSLHGWSYGVLLHVDPDDPGLLTPNEVYHEKQTLEVIVDTLHQVHRVGEGIIGKVALSRRHQWIFSDAYTRELCWTHPHDHPDVLKGNLELQMQFLAGIKTIAIISLLPSGVALFGSTVKVLESSDFINKIKHIFQKLGSLSEPFLRGDSQNEISSEIHEPHGIVSSLTSYGGSYATCKGIKDVCKMLFSKEQYSTSSNQSSHQLSMGSHLSRIHANMLPVPVMPSFTCTSLSTETSFQLRNQCLDADAEAQAILSRDTQILHDLLRYDSGSLNHSAAGYTLAKLRNQIYNSSKFDQWLQSGMETKAFVSRYPAMSQSVVSREALFQHFSEESGLTSLTGLNRSHETRSNIGLCATSKHSLRTVGHDATCSSTVYSAVEDNIPDYKLLSKDLSFAYELPAVLVPKCTEATAPAHDTILSGPSLTDNILQSNAYAQQMTSFPVASKSGNQPSVFSASSSLNRGSAYSNMPSTQGTTRPSENSIAPNTDSLDTDRKLNSSSGSEQLPLDADLFDGMELDFRQMFQEQGFWDEIFMPVENGDIQNLSIDVSEHTSELDKNAMSGHEKGFFSEVGLQHILDAIGNNKVDSSTSHSSVITCVKSSNNQEPENQFSASSNLENTPLSNQVQQAVCCFTETTDLLLPRDNVDKIMQESSGLPSKATVGSWIEDSRSMNEENAFANRTKKPEESVKVPKKRARPGESTRPRPKDRQQIQDRVKELREIVPNGAKCSIDALLARTVNHMLFLQGVIKYADKIKQSDQPKMIGEETGVILRDSPSTGGGATWAYEVAGQTIVCPITVKELNPPGQMLIEILCEDRGSLLEIADSIRGFGLTILKGVMEAREKKIWAHFLVEANKEVTRMEIFLHLVQLLTKPSGTVGSCDRPVKAIDIGIPTFSNHQQSPMPIPISLVDRGR